MEARGLYVIAAIAVGLGTLGFAGYRHFQSQDHSNKGELIQVDGALSSTVSGAATSDDRMDLPEDRGIGVGEGIPNSGAGATGTPGGQGMPPSTEGRMGRRADGPVGEMGSGRERPNRPNMGGGGSAPVVSGNALDILGMGGMLIKDEKVMEELKLTATQKKQIEDATKMPERSEGAAGQEGMQGMVQEMQRRSAELGPKLSTILTAQQKKRYEELIFQQFGPALMLNPGFEERFGLSEAEKTKMTEMTAAFAQEQMQKFQGGGNGGQRGGMPNLAEVMKGKADLDKKIISSLDADSQAKWKSATGKEFKFANPMAGLGGLMSGMGAAGGRRGRN